MNLIVRTGTILKTKTFQFVVYGIVFIFTFGASLKLILNRLERNHHEMWE